MTRIQKILNTGRITPKPIKRKKETLNTHSKKTKKILVPALCCLAITGIAAIGLAYKKRKINIFDLKKTPNLNDKIASNKINQTDSKIINQAYDKTNDAIAQTTTLLTSQQTADKAILPVVSDKNSEITAKPKKDIEVKDFSESEEKVKLKTTILPDGQKCTTCSKERIKTIQTIDLPRACSSKTYIEQKGKYVPLRRDFHKVFQNKHKIIEHFPDGTTKITLTDNEGSKIIFKDRKGNTITPDIAKFKAHIEKDADLINNDTESLSSGWYKEYQNLCKKYNEFQRPLGVPCGANDHYFELLQRDMESEVWAEYLKIEQFRTSYDDNSRLMKYLREKDNSKIFDNQKLTAEDTQTLINSDAKSFLNAIRTAYTRPESRLENQDALHNIAVIIKADKDEADLYKKARRFRLFSKIRDYFHKKTIYLD